MFTFFKNPDATSADLTREYAEADAKKQELETRRATVRQKQVELLADGFNGEDTSKAAAKIRAEHDDIALQIDVLTEIQERIRNHLASGLRQEKQAELDQIIRDQTALREARGTLWREFLVAAAKAAVLKEQLDGVEQLITPFRTVYLDPSPNILMSQFTADDREFYSLAVLDARGGPPPGPGTGLDQQSSMLSYQYRLLSGQLQEFDADRAVAEALQAGTPDDADGISAAAV